MSDKYEVKKYDGIPYEINVDAFYPHEIGGKKVKTYTIGLPFVSELGKNVINSMIGGVEFSDPSVMKPLIPAFCRKVTLDDDTEVKKGKNWESNFDDLALVQLGILSEAIGALLGKYNEISKNIESWCVVDKNDLGMPVRVKVKLPYPMIYSSGDPNNPFETKIMSVVMRMPLLKDAVRPESLVDASHFYWSLAVDFKTENGVNIPKDGIAFMLSDATLFPNFLIMKAAMDYMEKVGYDNPFRPTFAL